MKEKKRNKVSVCAEKWDFADKIINCSLRAIKSSSEGDDVGMEGGESNNRRK